VLRLIWLLAVGASGLASGFLAIFCGRLLTRLTAKQCIWLPVLTPLIVWLCAGAIADYMFGTTPWAWAGRWSSSVVAGFAWLALTELISIRIFDARLRRPS